MLKLIISPAKSLDFESEVSTELYSIPAFLKHSQILMDVLKKKTPNDLSILMHISSKLSELNYIRNKQWSLPFTINNAKQSVFVFTGDVYKGLDVRSLNPDLYKVLDDKLRILSGLYGLLKPFDLIQPYRLEMGTKLHVSDESTNLYKFWGTTLVSYLNEELTQNDFLIDLASKEYSKSIPKDNLNCKLITPVFKELKGEVYKVVAIHSKRARGLMARYIIENNIDDPEELKMFTINNYSYSELLSSENEYVFTR